MAVNAPDGALTRAASFENCIRKVIGLLEENVTHSPRG
jgi:hypothetical protein